MEKNLALEILKENIQNENLRKHHYAVAAALKALAPRFGGDPAVWEIVGLLHDADYEETKDQPERHAAVMAEKLTTLGAPAEIITAIKAHNYDHLGVTPNSKLDWALIASDDLTGLIIAVALVHPEKLSGVSADSVLKKFDSKSFAAGADRERIRMCENQLRIPLAEFIPIVLSAMQGISGTLGF